MACLSDKSMTMLGCLSDTSSIASDDMVLMAATNCFVVVKMESLIYLSACLMIISNYD